MPTNPPITTALSLDTWRRTFGFHPWHFFGMADADVIPVTPQCPTVVKQYAWQNTDAAGREDILNAIASAEQKLLDYLRYRPGAMYSEATLPWPQPGDHRLARWGYSDPQGRWMNVPLPEAMLQGLGVEARTLLGTPAITYSDPNSTGINTLATVTVATTVTDPDEIAVYFQASDRLNGDPVSEQYRIRPVRTSISGGTATIRIPAYLLVRPINYETISPTANDIDLDPATVGVLAVNLEVYRYYTDPDGNTVATSQGVITWETRPCHGWWCCCNGCSGASAGSPFDPNATATAIARVGIRNAERGVVLPAASVYDATSATWAASPSCQEPDRVTVRYLAGVPLVNGDMDSKWATVVARLAAAELARPICACQEANRELYRWQFDAAIQSEVESYQVSPEDLLCPWGTRRGHIQAWRFVQRKESVRAFTE
jgi:hypothetical protein